MLRGSLSRFFPVLFAILFGGLATPSSAQQVRCYIHASKGSSDAGITVVSAPVSVPSTSFAAFSKAFEKAVLAAGYTIYEEPKCLDAGQQPDEFHTKWPVENISVPFGIETRSNTSAHDDKSVEPARDGTRCVDFNAANSTFTNFCSYRVFVTWCTTGGDSEKGAFSCLKHQFGGAGPLRARGGKEITSRVRLSTRHWHACEFPQGHTSAVWRGGRFEGGC